MSNFENWKNKERGQILAKRFGLKFNIDALSESKKEYDLDENNNDRIFAPNHYCAHHVRYEGREAFTVDHNWNDELQEVTQYDIKFEDGTVLRDVDVADLEVLVAMDESSHTGKRDHPPAKRDGKLPMKTDKEDADEDGDTTDKVPAYLDKGETKKKKKGGKVPPQLQKHVKSRSKKDKKDKKDDNKTMKEQSELKDLIKQQIRIALEEIKNES